jgi:hypothetical protein
MNRCALAAGLLGPLALATLATAAEQPKVGVAAAVNPDAVGRTSEAKAGTLYVGSAVMFKEHITTSANGQAQLLFLDQSALTVAPNADLLIDEFVYDPEKHSGKLAATMTKGLFRFVGGQISKQQDVQFKTPTAEIGIRGGVALINVGANGATKATFLFGEHMTVTAGGDTKVVTRPGFTVAVSTPNAPPSPPVKATANEISGALGALEGKPGATGGATQAPTEEMMAQHSVAPAQAPDSISSNPGQHTTPAPAVSLVSLLDPPIPANLIQPPPSVVAANSTPAQYTGPFSGRYKSTPGTGAAFGTSDYSDAFNRGYTDGRIANGFFTADLGGDPIVLPSGRAGSSFSFGPDGTDSPYGPVSGTGFYSADGQFIFYELNEVSFSDEHSHIFGGVPTPKAALQSTGFRVNTFQIRRDAMLQSAIPFIRPEGGGNIPNAVVSPLYIAQQSTGLIGSNETPERTTALQASLAIDGQGANQSSVIEVTVGVVRLDSNTADASFVDGKPLFAGGTRGFARLSATGELIRSSSSVTSEPDGSGNSFFGSTGIGNFVLDNALVTDNFNRIEQNSSIEINQSRTSSTTYGFNQVATLTATPAGVGGSRTAQTLNGYVGGLGQSFSSGMFSVPVILLNQGNSDPSQVTIRTFPSYNRLSAQFNVVAYDPSAQGNFNGAGIFKFGGVGTGDDIFQPPPGQFFFASRSAFIDDNLFAANEQIVSNGTTTGAPTSSINGTTVNAMKAYMVSSGAVPASNFLPAGVSFCTCQYLSWGYWGADFVDPNNGEIDSGHLMSWVAGVLPGLAEIPQTGIATYVGHAIGNVVNGSAQYVAVGKFQNNWNFGTRTGSISITQFDNMNFSGTAAASVANPRDYTGGFSGRLPNGTTLNGAVYGSFFKGGGNPVAATGGHFDIVNSGGTLYRAAGIFAASKQ